MACQTFVTDRPMRHEVENARTKTTPDEDPKQSTTPNSSVLSIELAALPKLINFLIKSDSETISTIESHYREILTKLNSLLEQWDDQKLEDFLTNDSSLRKCEYCKVIRCSKALTHTTKRGLSPPRNFYFLDVRDLRANDTSDDKYLKMYQARKKIQQDNAKIKTQRTVLQNRQDEKVTANQTFKPRQNDNTPKTPTKKSFNLDPKINSKQKSDVQENNPVELENNNVSNLKDFYKPQIPTKKSTLDTKVIPETQKVQIQTDRKKTIKKTDLPTLKEYTKDLPKNTITSNLKLANAEKDQNTAVNPIVKKKLNNTTWNKVHEKQQQKLSHEKCLDKNTKENNNINKKSKLDTHLEETTKLNKNITVEHNPEKEIFVKNSRSVVDIIKHLIHGRFPKKESKDKFCFPRIDEKLQFKQDPKKYSFVLHNNRDEAPQLDGGFWLYDEPTPFAYPDKEKYFSKTKRIEESKSVIRSVDNDSLENCSVIPEIPAQIQESNTTAFSSSSAEKMIREWVKPSENYPHQNKHRIKKDDFNYEYTKCAYFHDQIRLSNSKNSSNFWFRKFTKQMPDAVYCEKCHKRWIHQCFHSCESFSRKSNYYAKKKYSNVDVSTDTERNLKTVNDKSISTNPSKSTDVTSENFVREINYDKSSDRQSDSKINIHRPTNMLPVYRKVLKNGEQMDWGSFQRLVENLYPEQKHLWADICKAIGEEVKRVADESGCSTEVCIEINPIHIKEKKKVPKTCSNEITFEMDMTLKDIQNFLKKKISSKKKRKTSSPAKEDKKEEKVDSKNWYV